MADDKRQFGMGSGDDDAPQQEDFGALTGDDDSGLGNLPPLSEFESSEGGEPDGLDSNLPPLGSLDSDSDHDVGTPLPPISEIPIETPMPTGGNIKAAPPGFDAADAFDTPASSRGVLETPDTPEPTGFQDLTADSDFTPETPEVAPPGPDSDMETPLFDSAFGGGDTDFSGVDTSAPTQAMETPLFGESAPAKPRVAQPDFDADAFGSGDFFGAPAASPTGGGTPMPDFSADTGAAAPPPLPMAAVPPPMMGEQAVAPAKARRGVTVGGILIGAGIFVVSLIVGLFFGPLVASKVPSLPCPNPTRVALEEATNTIATQKSEISQKTAEIGEKDALIKKLTEAPPDSIKVDPKEIERLVQERNQVTQELEQKRADLKQVEADIEAKNQEYVRAQQEFEELLNQTSIVRARQMGLRSEVERLQGLVGQLDDANARRAATKAALETSVTRLAVTVRDGCPLTPEKYSHERRLAKVEDLQARVAAAKWVDPDLLNEYTNLYLAELELAATRSYFFARIPVVDRFGTKTLQWAECLMNGNWSVYYRTLDGSHLGTYTNVATTGPAQFEFQDLLPAATQKQIEQEILANRTQDYQQRLQVLAEKELLTKDTTTAWQKGFDSLMH